MLSRVAESIFWMSRYIERAANVARLIEVNLNILLDQPRGQEEQWRPLVMITGDRENFARRYPQFTREHVMEFLIFDRENPNSVLSSLRMARENARSVREALPSEMWEQLNSFYLSLHDPDARARLEDDPHEFFSQIKIDSQLFVGIAEATQTRDKGWHFSHLGRLIERADKTSRVLDVKYFILLPRPEDVGSPLDALQWAALLRSASGFEMYRKRYGNIRSEKVVEFLMLDRQFPRAMLYCLIGMRTSLHAISGSSLEAFDNLAEQRLGRLHAELAYARVDEIISSGLHEFLNRFQISLNRLGDAIFETFFDMHPARGSTQTQNRIVA